VKMFFGFSKKIRNRNRNNNRNRKKNRTGKKYRKHYDSNNSNIKFEIEEIDTPPESVRKTNVHTVKTNSLTPVIFSNDASSDRNKIVSVPGTKNSNATRNTRSATDRYKKTRKIQMRTPTPYRYTYRDTKSASSILNTDSPVRHINSNGDIILFFMDMLTTVKLYHWKTLSYATHKATDELYEDLNKYVDEFVEVLIGHKGGIRINLPRTTVKLHDCSSPNEFKRKINGYKNTLIGLTSRFNNTTDNALLNIRDEIISALDKSLYVMSFK
jgi:DNA-binding ferritin-like protein